MRLVYSRVFTRYSDYGIKTMEYTYNWPSTIRPENWRNNLDTCLVFSIVVVAIKPSKTVQNQALRLICPTANISENFAWYEKQTSVLWQWKTKLGGAYLSRGNTCTKGWMNFRICECEEGLPLLWISFWLVCSPLWTRNSLKLMVIHLEALWKSISDI